MKPSAITATLLLFLAWPAAAQIIHVPGDYPTIQEGINAAANGDTVLVAPGTYFENLVLSGPNIILASHFLITGDTSYISSTVINGGQAGSVITVQDNIATITRITGFSITNGESFRGGGINIDETDPYLDHLKVFNNKANGGGGICITRSNSVLDHLEVYGNSAVRLENYSVEGGGGLLIQQLYSSVTVKNTVFKNNMSGDSGGGIKSSNSSLMLENVDIVGNTARFGGGFYGPGVYLEMDPVNRCNIHSNRAELGNDLRNNNYQEMQVYVDTFSVLIPTNFHVDDTSNYVFDILYGKFSQVNADLYVSPSGDDNNSGLLASEPLKTIHTACSKMLPFSGDTNTIYLAQGTYSPSASNEFFPVTMLNYKRLIGEVMDSTILDAEGKGGVIRIRDNSFNEISDMTITGGMAVSGGGIYCYSDNATLKNLNIHGNSADDGGGITGKNCSPDIIECYVHDNSAIHQGGGIYLHTGTDYDTPNLNDLIITNNTAEWGGGISIENYSYGNFSTLYGVSVSFNTAENGGGIAMSGVSPYFDNINRCSVYLNEAATGNDLTTAFPVQVVLDTFTVLNPTEFQASPLNKFSFDIQHGMLQQVEADLYISPDGDNNNSGLTADDPLKTIHHAQSILIITDTSQRHIHLLDGTYSPGTNGEFFPVNLRDHIDISGTADSLVILDADSTSRVMQIVQNDTNRVTDLTLTGGNKDSGGGMYIVESDPYLERLTISQNATSYAGGGIYCQWANPYMNELIVSDNQASDFGGGIYLSNSIPLLKNSLISGNVSGNVGGGISTLYNDSVLQLEDLIIQGNFSGSGAGIYNNGRLKLLDCELKDNHADAGEGGGIRSSYDSLWMLNVEIRNNSAQSGGGTFIGDNAFASLDSVMIIDNLAFNNGGGVNVGESSNTYFNRVLIKSNHSSDQGGGIYSDKYSEQEFHHTDIVHNSAAGAGGGIYWANNAIPAFDSVNRCNIFLNDGGFGNDIFNLYDTLNIVVDTFTVMHPTDYHAEYRGSFTFDIRAAKMEQMDADLYVSPTGDDNNTGLAPEDPLKTIDKAYQRLRSGSNHRHTVHLANGTYSPPATGEKFPVRVPHFSSLSGQSRDLTILDGEDSVQVMVLYRDTVPEIKDLTITGGKAIHGAGFSINRSETKLFNISIVGNESSYYGGGLYTSRSRIDLSHVIVEDNMAASGAGIYLGLFDTAAIKDCRFRSNIASDQGGGMYSSPHSFLDVSNTIIDSNQAVNGGGAWAERSYPSFKNCLFTNNTASHMAGGAGLYDEYNSGQYVLSEFLNTTFTENGPYALLCYSENVRIANSIFWGNSSIYQILLNQTGSHKDTLTIEFSDIQNGMDGVMVFNGAVLEWLDGNIEEDPMFLIGGEHPYTLEDGSPCIDAGTPDTTGLGLPLNDILGNTRIWDGDGNGTFIIDMGPYEYDAPVNVGEDIFPNEQSSNEILVYPNPARDNLKIILPGNSSGYSITLHNPQGQTIHSLHIEAGHENVNMPVKHLPAGLYMMIIRNEKGNTFTEKILVMY
jgi:hypothetical protein